MSIYFLKDLSEGCVDAVIIAKSSTKEDIENAISEAKKNDGYIWDDIKENLPGDCEVHDRWSNEEIYY